MSRKEPPKPKADPATDRALTLAAEHTASELVHALIGRLLLDQRGDLIAMLAPVLRAIEGTEKS